MAINWRRFRPKFKELWFVDVTYTDSQEHEQKGVRPCLIIKEFQAGDMVLIIPFTKFTKESSALRFPFTVKIEKNNTNELNYDSVALIFQMKSVSKVRFKKKIGRITNNNYKKIEIYIKNIFRL